MNRDNTMTIIEDSSGNRYCFTYKNFSIYCKEVTCYGDIKESLLVSQVNEDFIATIGAKDTICLICCNKAKGILLFTHSEKGWIMTEVLYSQADITLLDIFVVEELIHILYATRLPIANYHNVYHLHNRHGHWEKSNISEIFSENIHLSFSSTITGDNCIHLINVWHDGKKHILNNCIYNSSSNRWSSKKLAALVSGNITVELIADSDNLHLLFHAFEDDISLLFYFAKKASDSSEFNFISLNKMVIGETKYPPIYNTDNDNIYMEWISDNIYHKHLFDMSLREWAPQIEQPLPKDAVFELVTFARNEKEGFYKSRIYCNVSSELNMQKPYENPDEPEELEPEEAFEVPAEDELKLNNNIDDLVPYLIGQIKNLSDDIKNINTKLNINDSGSSTGRPAQRDTNSKDSEKKAQKPKHSDYKKSKFKDDFINNKISPTSLSLRTTSTPQSIITIDTNQGRSSGNFKNAFMNANLTGASSHITGTTYHGSSKNTKAYRSPDTTQQDKLNYLDINTPKKGENSSLSTGGTASSVPPVPPAPPVPPLTADSEKSDTSTIFKKIGDFFKQNF